MFPQKFQKNIVTKTAIEVITFQGSQVFAKISL